MKIPTTCDSSVTGECQ